MYMIFLDNLKVHWHFFFKHYPNLLFIVCICGWAHIAFGVQSLLPPHGSLGSNLNFSHQTWLQALVPTEPSWFLSHDFYFANFQRGLFVPSCVFI